MAIQLADLDLVFTLLLFGADAKLPLKTHKHDRAVEVKAIADFVGDFTGAVPVPESELPIEPVLVPSATSMTAPSALPSYAQAQLLAKVC